MTQYISNQLNMSKPLKIFKPKKMELTIDARDIFCAGKNARVIHIVFTIRDNIVFQKIESRNVEIGRIEQIRIGEYLQEMDNIQSEMVFTHLKDCWRFIIDVDVANKLYETKPSLSVEDLCIALGCLQRQEKKAFYNVCLLDYTELPMEYMEAFSQGKEHEFILLENKNIYPEVYCKMELFASTKA